MFPTITRNSAYQAVDLSCLGCQVLADEALHRQIRKALCIGSDCKQHDDGEGLESHGDPGSSGQSGLQSVNAFGVQQRQGKAVEAHCHSRERQRFGQLC